MNFRKALVKYYVYHKVTVYVNVVMYIAAVEITF